MHIRTTLVALGLMLVGVGAGAGITSDLAQLMEGKTVLRDATCSLDAKGFFPANAAEKATKFDCTIYVDYDEKGDIYYALIRNSQNRPTKVIRVDNDDGHKQTVIWSNLLWA